MNWSEPITRTDPHFSDELVPLWAWVLAYIEPIRDEAIAAQEWRLAKQILDDLRDPDVETANARWREFVVALWRLRDGWVSRRLKQLRARRVVPA